ncbi:MAG TPA: DUF4333 domain-containing protein [Pseudonocardiaceae bacterium]|nr:DUF4333 domain-containing protein [Pseudonocardiaceae bacterium]
MFHTARAVALTASCVSVLLAGCSTQQGIVHNGMIDKVSLARSIVDVFHTTLGDEEISVTCQAPLKAEVGQTETCSDVNYSLNGQVTATITSIDNGNPQYKLLLND